MKAIDCNQTILDGVWCNECETLQKIGVEFFEGSAKRGGYVCEDCLKKAFKMMREKHDSEKTQM